MASTKHAKRLQLFMALAFAIASLQAQAPPTTSTISVKNFGATGDGTTNDTDAINNAMKSCASRAFPSNGCNLYFPSGIYITTGLVLQSYVHITGDGWATSVIKLKPRTSADVVSIPASTFNFSITGVTIDGNSSNRGDGNCLTIAATPVSPGNQNTSNKQTAPVNAFKFGSIQQDMFSNCSKNGIHINAYNYALFVDNIYVFKSGVYGIYDAGTDSIFSNIYIEASGTTGLYISGANNKFTTGKVIWSGTRASTEAAVYVSGMRNTLTAMEAQDNYTSGFSDTGTANQFSACLSDANGYVRTKPDASSRAASGFIISGTNGIYIGNKVTSYRGRLPDGNFPTQWPYLLRNTNQSRVDISYDSTNAPPPAASTVPQTGGSPLAGHGACIKSAGPPVVIGYCSTALDASGNCACN